MEQLNLVRNEQEERVHDAVMKTSKELEKSHKKLEEKVSEMSKRVASLVSENSYLSKALVVKEKLIEELNSIKNQTEAEFEALMMRLDSVEKENAFLRYEFRTLEKELDLRNEELEYGRRSEEASHKQHLESIKKIKKLEAECQRLRSLTRKRLPGPAVLANIKSDIEGRNQINTRRKAITGGLGSGSGSVFQDSGTVYSPDNTNKKLGFLIDQMQDLEKENRILKECLAKKEEEETSYHREVRNFSDRAPDEVSLASGGVVDSNEITGSRPQMKPECKMIGASDMSLMDDFVEMEKLAIVAVDTPLRTSFAEESCTKKELILIEHDTKDSSAKKANDWLQIVGSKILEQHNISKKSLEELLGDIKMSLQGVIHPEPSKLLPISGYITWKSPTSSPRSSLVQQSSTELLQTDVNRSIGKIIELVGRFHLLPTEDQNVQDELICNEKSSKAADYKIRVFRWKTSELTAVLQDFIHGCNNLLDGKINFEKFFGDLTSILGWIIDNCVSYQDHSTVRDEFIKHLGGSGPGTALELESVQNLMLEMEKMYSVFQAEIEGLKNDPNLLKSSDKDSNENLQNEMEMLKESKRITKEQLENLKVANEDLDTQLSVTKAKLSEVLQKLSSVQVELDSKSHLCEELEGTCVELQLQLESANGNQHSEDNENQEELLRTGMEITKASVKLAECEETILKLGKQLKSLGSAKELSVVDKVLAVTDTNNKKLHHRSSLRDQMLSEDNTVTDDLQSPKTKEVISTTEANQVADSKSYIGMKNETISAKAGALAVIPSKKRGGGISFLRKLLLRRRKGSSKNSSIFFGK
ncbi:hypothetical protein CDL12_18675 [Handroanthus impetiginosus]|uniref:Filament-like plant protein 7 n=1 Tax=Handroanthus impetiginosus TaxID=429701 RepID=A0A2G9GTZ9_9LAMI|nr:hypothetical protein CDL12_18675 [Handroanthus impetiginosus]